MFQLSRRMRLRLLTEENAAESRKSWTEIASLPNENPGDTFSGADHEESCTER